MPQPVFAFLAFTSGSYEGAIIRDMRLANDLHRRGFKVVVYWLMETNGELVDAGITQRMLARGTRFYFRKPSGVMDAIGGLLRFTPAKRRRRFAQENPNLIRRLMCNLMRIICDGGRGDPALLNRLEKYLIRDQVTHLLPTFAWSCPIAQRIKERGVAKFDYLPTFQGEEIFAHFAMQIDQLADYHRVLQETVAGSGWPAVAVSRDYILRLRDEMGIDPTKLVAIHPGIDLPDSPPGEGGMNDQRFAVLKKLFRSLKRDVPVVTFLGRQDPEKGIDLLLYACRMLQDRGVKLQLVCAGGSSFGLQYRKSMEAIAEHLRLTVFWAGRVSNEVRTTLFQCSRCIVYPSIHREPFGMVAAEAMSFGTPVLVPNLGGITEVINIDGKQGGLTFNAWDSTDLAAQLHKLMTDDALHKSLQENTRALAAVFSVKNMTDAVLGHLGVDGRP